jgi:hypothetical protein
MYINPAEAPSRRSLSPQSRQHECERDLSRSLRLVRDRSNWRARGKRWMNDRLRTSLAGSIISLMWINFLPALRV